MIPPAESISTPTIQIEQRDGLAVVATESTIEELPLGDTAALIRAVSRFSQDVEDARAEFPYLGGNEAKSFIGLVNRRAIACVSESRRGDYKAVTRVVEAISDQLNRQSLFKTPSSTEIVGVGTPIYLPW